MTSAGIVGPLTWASLMSVSASPPSISNPTYPGAVLRLGSTGANVATMQGFLNTIRSRFPSIPALTADGSFGPLTQSAVETFQRLMGLTPDGQIGPATWNFIVSVYNAVNMGATRASIYEEESVEPENEPNVFERAPKENNMLGFMLMANMLKNIMR